MANTINKESISYFPDVPYTGSYGYIANVTERKAKLKQQKIDLAANISQRIKSLEWLFTEAGATKVVVEPWNDTDWRMKITVSTENCKDIILSTNWGKTYVAIRRDSVYGSRNYGQMQFTYGTEFKTKHVKKVVQFLQHFEDKFSSNNRDNMMREYAKKIGRKHFHGLKLVEDGDDFNVTYRVTTHHIEAVGKAMRPKSYSPNEMEEVEIFNVHLQLFADIKNCFSWGIRDTKVLEPLKNMKFGVMVDTDAIQEAYKIGNQLATRYAAIANALKEHFTILRETDIIKSYEELTK